MRPWDSVGGHALHAVHPALVLQPGPDALPGLGRALAALGLHGDLDVLVAAELGLGGVDDLGLPADPLGVAQVHAQQVAGEQRRLVAARARLDLEDDVLVVAGVARDEQKAELLGRAPRACFSSSLASAAKSGSSAASSFAVSMSSPVCFQERYVATIGVSSA